MLWCEPAAYLAVMGSALISAPLSRDGLVIRQIVRLYGHLAEGVAIDHMRVYMFSVVSYVLLQDSRFHTRKLCNYADRHDNAQLCLRESASL